MKLVIMRHGDAAFNGMDTSLTPKGMQEARSMALKLAEHVNFNKCFVSDKLRACQTADIVLSCQSARPKKEINRAFAPDSNPQDAIAFIEENTDSADNVLVVSHLPLVNEMVHELCGDSLIVPLFQTACAALLERRQENRAILQKFFLPNQF